VVTRDRHGVITYEDLAESASLEELIQRAEEEGAEWLIGEPLGPDAPSLVLVVPYKHTLLTRDDVQDLIDALSVVAVRAWGREGEGESQSQLAKECNPPDPR